MKRTTSLSLIVIGLTLSIIGCSNPKDANKDNFAKALKKSLASNTSFCSLTVQKMPVETKIYLAGYYPWSNNQLNAFSSAGLLKREESVKTETRGYGVYAREQQVKVIKYDLSDTGKQLAKPDKNGYLNFTYCKPVLKEVISFTEPSGALGATISRVKYSYVIQDFQDWAKSEAITKTFPEVRNHLAAVSQPVETEQTLVLTNEGWSTQL